MSHHTLKSTVAVLTLLLVGVASAEEIAPRRVTLPNESLAREAYLTVPSGAFVAALSYEYEPLHEAFSGKTPTLNRENSFTLNSTAALDLSYGLSDNITLNAIIPYKYVYNTHRVDSGLIAGTPGVFFDSRRGAQGIGDAILMTYLRINFGDLLLFGSDYYPRGNDGYDDYISEGPKEYAGQSQGAVFSLALGVRLPTGRTDVVDADGKRLPDALQLGTGTMDPIAGLLYHHRYYRFGWGLSGLARISSTENIHHYQWGNEVLGATYVSFRLNRSLEWVNQANGTWMDRDRLSNIPVTDRGSTTIFYTPSLIYVGSRSATLQASAEIPIYRKFNENQLASHYIVNLRTTFLFR